MGDGPCSPVRRTRSRRPCEPRSPAWSATCGGEETPRSRTTRFVTTAAVLDKLEVDEPEFAAARAALTLGQRAAISHAIGAVTRFHEAQVTAPLRVETSPGVVCERIDVPLHSVGLYVPAGSAPLPSTAIMLAVPARLAGCARRIVCTPPRADGSADPGVLAAARECGVTAVYKVGGAQAIAALAYGTETVPRVDKIFGPGNRWVTMAKELVASDAAGPAIDLPAGPSEVLVIADEGARADFVAADLLAQAEHSPDAQVLLVTDSRRLALECIEAVERQLADLPRREIATRSIAGSRVIVVPDLDTALARRQRVRTRAPHPAGRRASTLARPGSQRRIGVPGRVDTGDARRLLQRHQPRSAHRGTCARAQRARPARLHEADFGAGSHRRRPARARTCGGHPRPPGGPRGARTRCEPAALRARREGRLMTDVRRLARPDILDLQPYQHAAWNPSLERLHANEMPWRAIGDDSAAGLNRYPEPQPRALLERLARLYGVPPECILAGRGSDEAIDLLVRAFCRAGEDQVVVCPPTFGYYSVAARIQGAAVHEVPLRASDFALDAAAVIEAGSRAKLVFICSPEQPHRQPPGRRRHPRDLPRARGQRTRRARRGLHRVLRSAESRVATCGIPQPRRAAHLVEGVRARRRALRRAACLRGDHRHHGAHPAPVRPPRLHGRGGHAAHRGAAATARPRPASKRCATERERLRSRLVALRGVRKVLPSDANFLLTEFAAAAVRPRGRLRGGPPDA